MPTIQTKTMLVIPATELAALDEWRSHRQIWSRSSAIRTAIKRLIASDDGVDCRKPVAKRGVRAGKVSARD